MDIELKHTWRISKRAWYIRLYLWVWEAEEADITFCKLWWAYVFMWLALPVRLVICGGVRIKRISVRVANFIQRTSARVVRLFRANRQREDVLVDFAPKPVRPAQRYVARYPGERAGEQSVVGAFLGSLLKPLKAKMMEPRSVKDLTPEPEHKATMQRILEGISMGAASLSMKGRAVSYAIGHGIRGAARNVGIVLVSGILLVLKPVAYGAGGLSAFLVCTMKLFWMCVDRSLPYVDRMLTLVVKMIWFSLWPVRKTLSWVGRYLNKAGRVLAISWGTLTAVAYVGAIVYAVGVSIFLHPLVVLLILATFGAVVGVSIGIGFMFAYVMEKWFAPLFFREVLQPTWKGVERSTDTLQAGTVGFGRIMLIGFKSVKSNTCPKIEVEEEE